MATISLHRICLGVCDEAGDIGHKMLGRYMRYANIIAKDLIINVVPYWTELVVTSRVLPISGNFMVELPEDYIYYTKVGICSGGRICLLGVNNSLCGTDTSAQNCECTDEQTAEISSVCSGGCSGDDYCFYNTWRGSGYLGELYGTSAGRSYPGYFKEDKANNRIILSSNLSNLTNSELIIEYKADPTINGIALVPSECELAVREGIHWRDNLNRRPSVAQVHRENYIIEYNRLKKLYNSETEDTWRQIFLNANTATVKR